MDVEACSGKQQQARRIFQCQGVFASLAFTLSSIMPLFCKLATRVSYPSPLLNHVNNVDGSLMFVALMDDG